MAAEQKTDPAWNAVGMGTRHGKYRNRRLLALKLVDRTYASRCAKRLLKCANLCVVSSKYTHINQRDGGYLSVCVYPRLMQQALVQPFNTRDLFRAGLAAVPMLDGHIGNTGFG